MKVTTLKSVQNLPITLDEAWEFFATPKNLQKITPADMKFEILSDLGDGKVYPGQFIKYYVTPFLGIKLFWVTEITQVVEKKYFVDDQRVGPYGIWHHQHHFREIEGGVEMTDIVDYSVPFGPLGAIAKALFVKREVEKIFSFRYKALEEYFGKIGAPKPLVETV